MTEHSRSFHERLNDLLGSQTRIFLDKLRALYASGDVHKIIGITIEKTPLQSADDGHSVQSMPASAPEALAVAEMPTKVVSQAAAKVESTSRAERQTTWGRTISEFLQMLRQKYATRTPVFSSQLLQSAQTA